MDRGNTPYSSKVKTAPSTVPWLDKASASAISTTTYVQAMITTYIAASKHGCRACDDHVMAG